MVRLKGPGLSLEALGTIGNALNFSTCKGRPYLRKKPTPRQPKTGPQTGARVAVAACAAVWAVMPPAARAYWEPIATGQGISAFNFFVAYNTARLRNNDGISVVYPATATGSAATGFSRTYVGSDRKIKHTYTSTGAINQQLGIFVHQDVNPFTVCEHRNRVGFFLAYNLGTQTWWHMKLTPGTYYSRTVAAISDGLLATPSGQKSCTVT